MKPTILIKKASIEALRACEELMGQAVLVSEEVRTNFTASFPTHNRYFSNGDKPWVVLVNNKNTMVLTYDEKEFHINEDELVFFDDNVMHAWEMNNNDMTIYYYRAQSTQPIVSGTYCLDDYFD